MNRTFIIDKSSPNNYNNQNVYLKRKANTNNNTNNNIMPNSNPKQENSEMNNVEQNLDSMYHHNKKLKISDENLNEKISVIPNCQYLMPIHIVTCGLQGVDLGRDETAILEINYQIIDVKSLQVISSSGMLLQPSSLLDPTADPSKIHISVPAREMTGLLPHHTNQYNTPSHLYNQFDLLNALRNIHDDITQKLTRKANSNVNGEHSEQIENVGEPIQYSIVPVTCGDLPLRALLHREARFRNINLASYWWSYFNLLDSSNEGSEQKANNKTLFDLCSELTIAPHNNLKISADILNTMSECITYLLTSGNTIGQLNNIQTTYSPAVFHVEDPIDPDVVVMIKPIDYKTPISAILPFFRGVDIAPGGLAILMADGRRSNRILIRFTNTRQREIAMMRDKHHFEIGNSRFITITSYDSREFMKIAGYRNEVVKKYLNQIVDPDQVLVRMKGLPFTVNKEEILKFFDSHSVSIQNRESGIYLVEKCMKSGELNGDAFLLFSNESIAQQGIRLKGGTIGNRYIEIFQSTPAEMNQVMASVAERDMSSNSAGSPSGSLNKNNSSPSSMATSSSSTRSPNSFTGSNSNKNLLTSQGIITSMIPCEASDGDYLKFLGDLYGKCSKLTRIVYQNPLGHVAYIAELKDPINDSDKFLHLLSSRLFTIEKNRSHHVVTSTIFNPQSSSLPSPQQNFSPLLKSMMPSLASFPTNLLTTQPTLLPSASSILPTLPTPSPFLYPPAQVNPMLFNPSTPIIQPQTNQNTLLLPQTTQPSMFTPFNQPMFNFLNPSPLMPAKPPQTSYVENMTPPNQNGNEPTNRAPINNLVYLYGANSQNFVQNDLDSIFSSIKSYISELPKLFQNENYLYASFSTRQDAIAALQKCPIICHRNQILRLMPITE